MTAVYTFAISFVGIVAMFTLKIFEIKSRRKTRALGSLARFDQRLHLHFGKITKQIDAWDEKWLVMLKERFPKQTKFFFLLLKKNIKEKYEKVLPNIRGSRVLNKNGKVSPFLRDIAKYKKQNGGGRIDDGMVE